MELDLLIFIDNLEFVIEYLIRLVKTFISQLLKIANNIISNCKFFISWYKYKKYLKNGIFKIICESSEHLDKIIMFYSKCKWNKVKK